MVGKVKSKKKAVEEDIVASSPNVSEPVIMDEGFMSSKKKKKTNKKRSASESEGGTVDDTLNTANVDAEDFASEEVVDDDLNEPTMGERIESLKKQEKDNMIDINENEKMSHETVPPNANSINILLKQAIRADDRALLLDCLYTQDEKVIANSVSTLSSSDVLKLLRSLLANMESRGAILVCSLPWLKHLLLQHPSGITSQESSLQALNQLYQAIMSRVSTLPLALEVSSCLDFLFTQISEDTSEENETIKPIIYEDNDESDEDSDDSMQTDHDSNDKFSDGDEFSD